MSRFSRMVAAAAVALAAAFCAPAMAWADSGTLTYTKDGKQVTQSYDNVSSLLSAAESAGCDVTISLDDDWNTKGYGHIVIPESRNYTFNLNGHMINRDKAFSFGDKWYGEGDCDVIHVKKNATLTINGGTGDAAKTEHKGYRDGSYDGNSGTYYTFWKYDGESKTVIYGGLITGGAGDDHYGGGGISTEGTNVHVYLNDVTIAGNLADQYAGSYGHGSGVALHGTNSELVMSNSHIIYNHSEGLGGGVYVREDGTKITLKNGSEINNNYCGEGGGGIYVDDKNVTINVESGSHINNNYSAKSGGGVYFNGEEGTLSLSGTTDAAGKLVEGGESTLNGNHTSVDGGGVYSSYDNTRINLTNSEMSKNEVGKTNYGGGMYFSGTAIVILRGSTIKGNTAYYGGGIYAKGTWADINLESGSTVTENKASSSGSGIFLYCTSTIRITGESSICDNMKCPYGSGVWARGKLNIESSDKTGSITGNEANKGGGLYLDACGETISITGVTISSNKASTGGGILASGVNKTDFGTLRLTDTTVTRNNATSEAAGVYCQQVTPVIGGTVVITNNVIGENRSTCNLFLYSPGVQIGADSSNPPTKDCSIGVIVRNYDGSKRQLTNSSDFIKNVGTEGWSNIIGYDDVSHCIMQENGLLYLVNDPVKYKINVVMDGSTKVLEYANGEKVVLYSSEFEKTGYLSVTDATGASRRVYTEYEITSWTFKSETTTTTRIPANGSVVFYMQAFDLTATPTYTPSLSGIGLQLSDQRSWADFTGDTSTATVTGATLVSPTNEKTETSGAQGLTVKSSEVTDNEDGTKTVVYDVQVDSSLASAYGFYLGPAEYAFDPTGEGYISTIRNLLSSAKVSTSFGTADGTVEVTSANSEYTRLRVTATFSKPKTYTATVQGVDANTGSVVGTSAVSAEASTITVKAPEVDGRVFASWDETSLPTGTTVDGDKATIPMSGADVTVKATYVPGVDTVTLATEDLAAGEALPAALSSAHAKDANKEELTVKDIALAWTDADGKAVTTAQAGGTYTATITFALSNPVDGHKLTLEKFGMVIVNGMSAKTVNVDKDAGTVTVTAEMTATSDTTYDKVVTELDDVQVVEAGQFANFLPAKITYLVASGARLTADVTWDTSSVPTDQTYGTFEVKGYFEDINGDTHEVSRTFSLDLYVNGPKVSPAEGSYDSAVEVQLTADDAWTLSEDATMYYCLLKWDDQRDPGDVPTSEYVAYVPGSTISITEDSQLLTYAQVGNRTSGVDVNLYIIQTPHTVSVEGGKAYDSSRIEIGDAGAVAGQKVYLVADDAPEGYEFSGWSVTSGDVALVDASQPETSFTMPEGDVSVKATYKACPVTVHFDSDGGSYVEDRKLAVGEAVGALPVPTREGYEFAGWYNGDTLVNAATTFDADVTLKARWQVVKYTVSFMDGETLYSSATVAYGACAVAPATPTRTGYTFAGWLLDGVAYDFATPVTGDLTLTASWTVNSYTVTFETGEGSAVASQTVSYGEKAIRPAADPTCEGYEFAGWYADEACTVEFDFSTSITADTTVYARFMRKVSITFDVAGGELPEGAAAKREVVAGEPVGALPVPTREGFSFDGWYNGSTRATSLTVFTEDTKLVAKWRSKTADLHFVYFMDGDEVVDVRSVKAGEALVAPDAPTKAGHTFVAWLLDGVAYDFSQPVEGDLTLTASWTVNEYTVTFETGEGGAVASQSVSYGEKAVRPAADPTREGYEFAGWYADADCTIAFNFDQAITTDTTVYASFLRKVYVTFDAGKGSASETERSFIAGTAIGSLPVAMREGYMFVGWYIKGNKIEPSTVFSADATLSARWQRTLCMLYLMDGDELLDMQLVDYGSAVELTEDPVKDGYTLEGWYLDAELTQSVEFPLTVTSNTRIYSKWEKAVEPEPEPDPEPTPEPEPEPTPEPEPDTPTDETPADEQESEQDAAPATPETGDPASLAGLLASLGTAALLISRRRK
jgi:uncharacterized repeat protein (TIGR02543 family)